MHEERRTLTPPVRRLTIGRRRRVVGALLGAALAALLLTACGGGSSGTSSTATNATSSTARRVVGARNAQRLEQFAACMRQNGVHLPAPNATGKGPVFDTKGIDTTSAAFKKADAKCARKLLTRAGGPPNGPGAGTPAG